MIFGQKSSKPFRFPTLLLAAGLVGALCPSLAMASLTAGKKDCEKAFTDEFKKIHQTPIKSIDPEKSCVASLRAENNLISEPSQRPKLTLEKEQEIKTSFEGACHASYEAVQLVYEKLVENRAKLCEEMHAELQEKFPSCLSDKPVDTCKDHITEMSAIYEKGRELLAQNIENSRQFLKDYSAWNAEAKRKFIRDRDELQKIRGGGPQEAEKLLATVTPSGYPHTVDASKQGSDNLQQYLNKLEMRKIPRRSGISAAEAALASPIHEQEDAKALVDAFRKKLKKFREEESKNFAAKFADFRERLSRPTNTNTIQQTFQKAAPVAGPLASTFISGNNPAPSSGPGIGSGGSGALPALALAGAAGLAFSAGKSSGGSSLPDVGGPAITPNIKAAPTTFGELKEAPSGEPLTPPESIGEETESPAGSEKNAGAASPNGYGGGASVFPGGEKPKTNSPRAPATTAPTMAGDEALTPFSGDLRPAPRPAAAADTTGNEVSSLLGKMKDLFNLDESFGTDAPPFDHMSNATAAPVDGGAPHTGGADGEYPEDYAAEEEYENEEYSGADEQMQSSNPLGSVEITLFRRVHARHFKCMEKGLVLLMQQELPE